MQGVDGILYEGKNNHKNFCFDCARGYRIIAEIKSLIESSDVTPFNTTEISQLSNDLETVSQCKIHVDTLRSHLARHYTEAQSDSLDASNLDDIFLERMVPLI